MDQESRNRQTGTGSAIYVVIAMVVWLIVWTCVCFGDKWFDDGTDAIPIAETKFVPPAPPMQLELRSLPSGGDDIDTATVPMLSIADFVRENNEAVVLDARSCAFGNQVTFMLDVLLLEGKGDSRLRFARIIHESEWTDTEHTTNPIFLPGDRVKLSMGLNGRLVVARVKKSEKSEMTPEKPEKP